MSQPATNTRRENALAIVSQLDERKTEIGKALGKAIPTDKFIRVVKSTVQRQPELMECDPRSVIEACERAAADGLMIDGREAALVVYNKYKKLANGRVAEDERGNWIVEGRIAQYIPMFQGLLKRAYNSGLISNITANVVYTKELEEGRFYYEEGDNGHIHHRPLLSMDRGAPALAYSIVRMKDGSVSREVMLWEEILQIARRSPKNWDSKKSEMKGIWKTDTTEMAKKTVLRRHSKKLPMNSDVAAVFSRVDDLYTDEEGEAQPGEIAVPATPSKPRGGAAARLAAARTAPPEEPHDPQTGEIIEPERPAPRTRAARPQPRQAPPETIDDIPEDDRFPPGPEYDDAGYAGDVI